MFRKLADERGVAIIIVIAVAVVVAIALVIVIANRSDETTGPVIDPPTGETVVEPNPKQPTPSDSESPQPPEPQSPRTLPIVVNNQLPPNWNELTSADKIALNPLGCDPATQIIWASDGSCHDKAPDPPTSPDCIEGFDNGEEIFVCI